MDPIAWFVISFGKFWEFDGQVTPLKWTEYTLYRIALDYYHVRILLLVEVYVHMTPISCAFKR